jgi:hypothetical protein
MQDQGIFDAVLGYSLKREFLGESLNFRNVETFNLEIQATDLANSSLTNADGYNYISTYMINTISAKLNTDKHNITITSIEVPSSHEGKQNLISTAVYNVTAEVRTAVDAATLNAQHPELDTSTGAENHKFHGVASVLTTYAKEIDSISESFTFGDQEVGQKDFSHSVDVTVRSSSTQSAKTISQAIATTLFNTDSSNTYFGINTFTNALQTYGNSANNKHYFEESYDLKKNKFSFAKKMTIFAHLDDIDAPGSSTTDNYTANFKHTIDIGKDGRSTVSETVELKSRDGSFPNIQVDIPYHIAAAYTRCNAKLTSYNATIDGRGTNAVAPVLATKPLVQTLIYNKQGLSVTLSMTFSDDVQVIEAQFLETFDLSKDHRGVVTANYNVTLSSHRQKTLGADADSWVYGYCSDPGGCSDSTYNDKATCEANGVCTWTTDPHDNEIDCLADGGTWTPHTWTPYDAKTICESNSGTWFEPKTPLDQIKDYDTNALNRITTISNYSNMNASQRGTFWNTLSWYWPQGSLVSRTLSVTAPPTLEFAPVSTSISSPNMGKTFTLNKVFSNDYQLTTALLAGGLHSTRITTCNTCFKKIDVKWNDVWPKKTISEHPIVNRGSSSLTNNIPGTSVISDSYHMLPGKRAITINAVLKRSANNILLNPHVPVLALKHLAYEARHIMLQVFSDDRIKDSYQTSFYVNSITYTYDSDQNVSLTAEMTYTYKQPPPF